MTDNRREIDALFDAALDLPAAERRDFLDREAPSGPVREAVDRLLASMTGEEATAEMAGGLVDGALVDVYQAIAADFRVDPARPGDVIGPFRVIRELGRGGMAAVYLAERADGQVEQKVALKLSQSVAKATTAQRFHQERQILASLEHPGIARLVDAGLTEDGRPYFAMELVEGETLDVYCDRLRLSVADRLRLFVQVGRAVEAAHRALVVHRDIKPANVMVNAEGRVKLLDFGIAKLLDDDRRTAITATAAVVMTPDYASPEQYRGTPVTTASDVYQLGLLLYELLVGLPPYRVSTLSPMEALKAVCEDEPARPSTQLRRSLTGALPSAWSESDTGERLAELRRGTVQTVSKELKGDLDTIVLKALRKEPERRYASAADLVDDVERFLDGRPVSARGDGWAYRARKFVGRHRLAVVLATVAVIGLAGQLAFYTARLQEERNTARAEAERAQRAQVRSEQARDEAEEVVAFLQSLFAGSESGVQRADEISARELLDRGTERLRRELKDRPLTRARLLATIAAVSRRIGLYEEAEAAAEEALALRRHELGEQSLDTADSLQELAAIYRARGKLDPAEPLYRKALEVRRELGEDSGPGYLDLIQSLALIQTDRGRFEEAESLYREVGASEDLLNDEKRLDYYNNHALLLGETGRYQRAEALHRKALALRLELFGPDHIEVAGSYNNLALMVKSLGRLEEARDLQVKALEIKEKVHGPDSPTVAGTLVNLGSLEQDLGHRGPARAYLRRAIEIMGVKLGPTSPRLANAYTNLASVDLEEKKFDAAEASFQKALDIRRASLGDEHRDVGAAWLNLGELYRESGRAADAERAYLKSLGILEGAVGTEHPYFGYGKACLGKLYLAEARFGEAVEALTLAEGILVGPLGEDHGDVAEIRDALDQARRSAEP